MTPLVVSIIVFGCIFAGALVGLALHPRLPEHHRTKETQDVVRLGMGLVSSMAALVLGLLVASAKGAYDTRRTELIELSAHLVVLDRELGQYGPEAQGARAALREAATTFAAHLWPEEHFTEQPPPPMNAQADALFEAIQRLSPRDDDQRLLKSEAVSNVVTLGQERWLLFEQSGTAINAPFLVMLAVWLSLVLVSFGLFAPRNATVLASLFLSALSVSGALFLIMELDQPLKGMIRIPSTPMRRAIDQLGR